MKEGSPISAATAAGLHPVPSTGTPDGVPPVAALLTVDAYAKRMGVTIQTVRNWIKGSRVTYEQPAGRGGAIRIAI